MYVIKLELKARNDALDREQAELLAARPRNGHTPTDGIFAKRRF